MMRIVEILKVILRELMVPEVGGGWYQWATIATGHVLLGGLFITIANYYTQADWMWLAIVSLYWIVKEAADLRSGGGRGDSFVDTGFVGLGTAYGDPWMPIVAFVLIGVGAVWIIAGDINDQL